MMDLKNEGDARLTACGASFTYNGERIELLPARMARVSDTEWEYVAPDGLAAILTRAADGEHGFHQALRFEHRGNGDSGRIARVRALDWRFEQGGALVWTSLTGDCSNANSFNPIERALDEESFVHVEPLDGRPSNTTGFPFFDLAGGQWAVTCGIGWTGQWSLDIARSGREVRVEIGLAEADFYLRPGERVRGPMALCVFASGVGESRRRFRRVMLDSYSPRAKDGEPVTMPTALTTFDRYFYYPMNPERRPPQARPDFATEAGQMRLSDLITRIEGMDALWLDAAWFTLGYPGGVGNYSFAEGFPRGVAPVSAHAHEKGLRFIMWFEPERVNAYSETAREHPEMITIRPDHESVDALLRLDDEKTRAWLTERIIGMIRDNGVDVYRQDFNKDPLVYWRAADEPGRRGLTEMKHVEGLYAFWDALLAAFPGLLIDNCASGGRRLDVETCRRAVPLWRSDTNCRPVTETRRGHTWSQNHILGLTRYLPYHGGGVWEPIPYDVRSAATGGLGVNFDVLSEDFDFEAASRVIAEHRRLQRYWLGDFYPLTRPDNSEAIWAAWQLSLDSEGVAYAFRRDACGEGEFTLALRGIDPAARYAVTVTDERLTARGEEMSGKALTRLTVSCPAPRESVVVEYRRID